MNQSTHADVRVRFAPSPTGFLHVGGLRTALYNYLFARHHGGSMILRIEDTDKSREVEGAVRHIIDDLLWAGIRYDEGLMQDEEIIGDRRPYILSERIELYRQYAQQLIDADHAYYCFCSEERLEKVREQQLARYGRSKYDQHCRKLTARERKSRLEAGMPRVIRMKIPDTSDGEHTFWDAIRGEVSIPYENLDDQIIMKSDGFPTYHLASVVDDHLMEITHVIRGEEWLPSTPKHLLLYEYLDWDVPEFAHLPLLLNEDRSKLSKRQGDVMVKDYREKGYLPEALVNFVALLGWHPGDEREIFSLEELIEEFDLHRIGKSGAVFNVEKLQWMNGVYLRKYPMEKLMELSLPYLEKAGFETSDRDRMQLILETVRDNLRTLGDIFSAVEVFKARSVGDRIGADPELQAMVDRDSSRQVFEALSQRMAAEEGIAKRQFLSIMKEVQKATGVRGKNLWMPVRIALTGEQHGPELPAVVEILGNETCLERLREQLTA